MAGAKPLECMVGRRAASIDTVEMSRKYRLSVPERCATSSEQQTDATRLYISICLHSRLVPTKDGRKEYENDLGEQVNQRSYSNAHLIDVSQNGLDKPQTISTVALSQDTAQAITHLQRNVANYRMVHLCMLLRRYEVHS